MNNNIQNSSTTILCNRHRMDTDFLNVIYVVVQERVPSLPYDDNLTLKKICGTAFWEELEGYEVEMAGLCMSHLVTTNAVPMEHAGRDTHNAKLYRRTRR